MVNISKLNKEFESRVRLGIMSVLMVNEWVDFTEMKNFQLPRYKIIVQTVIGQKFGQLLRLASRCLWDPKTDNMVSVNYETQDMIAVVTVYAVYLE